MVRLITPRENTRRDGRKKAQKAQEMNGIAPFVLLSQNVYSACANSYRKERKEHKEKLFRLCDLCVLCGYHFWLRPEAALGLLCLFAAILNSVSVSCLLAGPAS